MNTVDKLMTRNLVNIQIDMSAIEAAKLMKNYKVEACSSNGRIASSAS
jgi:predicted transcriptional regulator